MPNVELVVVVVVVAVEKWVFFCLCDVKDGSLFQFFFWLLSNQSVFVGGKLQKNVNNPTQYSMYERVELAFCPLIAENEI